MVKKRKGSKRMAEVVLAQQERMAEEVPVQNGGDAASEGTEQAVVVEHQPEFAPPKKKRKKEKKVLMKTEETKQHPDDENAPSERTAPSLSAKAEESKLKKQPSLHNRLWAVFPDALPSSLLEDTNFHSLCRHLFQTQTSHWISANEKPRNLFESLALNVLEEHLGSSIDNSSEKSECREQSGAEFWVQIRGENEKHGQSLGFHWDMDYIKDTCPEVATVTYVTDNGAPTVVLDESVKYGAVMGKSYSSGTSLNQGGNQVQKKKGKKSNRGGGQTFEVGSGCASFPEMGKHICFRGDLLHGVPEDLMMYDRRRLTGSSSGVGGKKGKGKGGKAGGRAAWFFSGGDPEGMTAPSGVSSENKQQQQDIRITFLVNIWKGCGKPQEIPVFDHTKFRQGLEKDDKAKETPMEGLLNLFDNTKNIRMFDGETNANLPVVEGCKSTSVLLRDTICIRYCIRCPSHMGELFLFYVIS